MKDNSKRKSEKFGRRLFWRLCVKRESESAWSPAVYVWRSGSLMTDLSFKFGMRVQLWTMYAVDMQNNNTEKISGSRHSECHILHGHSLKQTSRHYTPNGGMLFRVSHVSPEALHNLPVDTPCKDTIMTLRRRYRLIKHKGPYWLIDWSIDWILYLFRERQLKASSFFSQWHPDYKTPE